MTWSEPVLVDGSAADLQVKLGAAQRGRAMTSRVARCEEVHVEMREVLY